MGLTEVLQLIGGIGLFLYGMQLMSDSLKQVAGAGLERILEKLTNSKLKGVTLGTVITAIVQSSAATSIMVVGFVNAGIMTLMQAVPVVMGANIGSTVTGQILRLGDIAESNIVLKMLKPSSFAPLLVAVAVCILLFCRKKKLGSIAGIMMGLGILFIGMSNMEAAFEPLRNDERFQNLFTLFTNPLLGILVGAGITAVIQSSSASVGILQAISSTGKVTCGMAVPIILGQNIGKCLTVWLGSFGTKREAKRVAFIHLAFNVIGVLLVGGVIYGAKALCGGFSFWNDTVNRGNIADFHSLFNIVVTVILLPCTSLLIRLAEKVFPDDGSAKPTQQLGMLDDLFLKTPAVALEQSHRVLLNMGTAVQENFAVVRRLLENYDEKLMKELDENERFLDKAETKLNEYLVKIASSSLNDEETRMVTEVLRNVSELERIGDYCINLADVAEYNYTNNIRFSAVCQQEVKSLTEAVEHIIQITLDAFAREDIVVASRVEPLEEVIDLLKETLTNRHVERLKRGECTVQGGISFVELLTNMERISDHCSNIAIHVIKKLSQPESFDVHEHLQMMHEGVTEEYKALFHYYESMYYDPAVAGKGEQAPTI